MAGYDHVVEVVTELASLLRPNVNHKCNLHVHVRPSVDLLDDLPRLKRVAQYLRDAEKFVYSVVEPLPEPTAAEFPDAEELRGARKRWRRNLQSHQHSL